MTVAPSPSETGSIARSYFEAVAARDLDASAQMAQQLGAVPPTGSLPERAMLAALNLKTRIARVLQRNS